MWLFICMVFLLTSTDEPTYEWMWDRSVKWDFHCGMSSCLQYRIITVHMHRDFCDSWCCIFQDCLRHSWQKDLAKNSVKQTSWFDVDYAPVNLYIFTFSYAICKYTDLWIQKYRHLFPVPDTSILKTRSLRGKRFCCCWSFSSSLLLALQLPSSWFESIKKRGMDEPWDVQFETNKR